MFAHFPGPVCFFDRFWMLAHLTGRVAHKFTLLQVNLLAEIGQGHDFRCVYWRRPGHLLLVENGPSFHESPGHQDTLGHLSSLSSLI